MGTRIEECYQDKKNVGKIWAFDYFWGLCPCPWPQVPMVTRNEQRSKGKDADETDVQAPGAWTAEEPPTEPQSKRRRKASKKTKDRTETKPKDDANTNGSMDVETETKTDGMDTENGKKNPNRGTAKAKAKAKSKPKTQPLKRPAASSSKTKGKGKEEDKTPKATDGEKVSTEEGDGAEEGGPSASQKKHPATWAGRWIPQKEDAKTPFFAIKKVYEKFCAPKLNSQSTLASPFFAQCMKAFSAEKIPDGAPEEDYLAAAELQAQIFLKTDRARYLALNVWERPEGMCSLGSSQFCPETCDQFFKSVPVLTFFFWDLPFVFQQR